LGKFTLGQLEHFDRNQNGRPFFPHSPLKRVFSDGNRRVERTVEHEYFSPKGLQKICPFH